MYALPDLTITDVRNWTNDRYYERGEGYFHADRIRQPRSLKAFCRGSEPSPYRVQIQLNADGIASGECSCPIGDACTCKHAVALLLTWVETPDAFEEVEPLSTRLQDLPKEQLTRIIRQMIDREPTLESVVDLAVNHPASNHDIDRTPPLLSTESARNASSRTGAVPTTAPPPTSSSRPDPYMNNGTTSTPSSRSSTTSTTTNCTASPPPAMNSKSATCSNAPRLSIQQIG